MLVCFVSAAAAHRSIAVEIIEAGAAAEDVPGLAGFIALLDAPASANAAVDAFTGEILIEAASAGVTLDAALVYTVQLDASASAADSWSGSYAAGIDAPLSEAAVADTMQDADVVHPWALVGSWTHSGNVAQVDFTGLAGYSEIRVLLRLVTSSSSGRRSLRVSTDNGSTFLSTSGDYVFVTTSGALTNADNIGLHTTDSASARSAEITISGWNLTAEKLAGLRTRTDFPEVLIPTSSALNALRVMNTAGNLSGGSIYVWART